MVLIFLLNWGGYEEFGARCYNTCDHVCTEHSRIYQASSFNALLQTHQTVHLSSLLTKALQSERSLPTKHLIHSHPPGGGRKTVNAFFLPIKYIYTHIYLCVACLGKCCPHVAARRH